MQNRKRPRGWQAVFCQAKALMIDTMVVLWQGLMWCVALWVMYHITVFIMSLIMWCQSHDAPPPYY